MNYLSSLIDTVRSAKDRLARAKAAKAQLHADYLVVRKIGGKVKPAYVTVNTFGTTGISATIRLYVNSIKHDRKLRNMLARAIELAELTGSDDYVTEWCAERTYSFHLPNGGELRIEANLKGDGATCRKVVVGETTELVTTKQYGISCD